MDDDTVLARIAAIVHGLVPAIDRITIGASRVGLTTNIHMLADTLGRPLRFIITAGQVGNITTAPALLEGLSAEAVVPDRAYDSNALRALIASMGTQEVIPSNRCRKIAIPHDHAV